MTFEELVSQYLVERGLIPEQALAVLDQVKAIVADTDMSWGDSVSSQPSSVSAALILTARGAAVQLIDANMPLHFARAMFDGSAGLRG